MKKMKQSIALLLAMVCILSCTACSNNPPAETTPGETDGVIETVGYTPVDYLATYSDHDTAAKWRKENIEDTNIPPIYFEIDETDSTKLTWTKTVGEEYTVVSYEDTDTPAERICQNIEYVCAEKGLKLLLTLTSYAGYPVIEYDTRLVNIGEGNSPEIKNVYTINADIADYSGSVTAHYNTGGLDAATAWQPHTQELTAETPLLLDPNYGLPTNDYIPYFNIEDTAGKDGVIAVLNWQGRWETEFSVADEQVTMRSGQYETDFVMLPEEDLKLPGVVLLFYKNGDWQYGQNIWRRWILEHNYMREIDERDFKENVYLCSDLSSGAEHDTARINAFREAGIQDKYNCTVEYDGGWYDIPGELSLLAKMMGAWTHTGHWVPKDIYGNGFFKKISDLMKENDMSLALWVEPERAFSDTKTALDLGDENMLYTKMALESYVSAAGIPGKRQVPYYLSLSEMLEEHSKNPQTVGIVNYSQPEAVDYIIEMLDGLIKEHGVSVYRQDFNVNPADFWAAYDRYIRDQNGVPRTGITEMKYCEGYLTVWSTLAERNPDLVFDACSHGGRRLDLETLRYSFAHTKTDYNSDVNAQQGQNFGSLSWLLHTGGAFTDYYNNYNFRSALSLSVGTSLNIGVNNVMNALEEWQTLHEYMYNDYYQLSEYDIDPSGKLALQFIDHEAGEGMMIAYLRVGGEYDLKAKALDPEANYKVWDKDDPAFMRVMSGRQLMEEGFYLAYTEGVAHAAVVYFEMTDEEVTPFDKEAYRTRFAVLDESKYEKETNDEAALVELHKASGVQGNQIAFLCADVDSSGGIYAVGRDFYDGILTTEQQNAEGWTWVDGANLYINSYPLTQWPVGTTFDIRGYVKEVDGCCFLWLDNTFSFGDADGGWSTGERTLTAKNGDESVTSDPFVFHVCNVSTFGGRDMQYAFADDVGNVVYQLTEKFYNRLVLSDNTFDKNGYTWTEIDYTDMYFRIPFSRTQTNIDDDSLFRKVPLRTMRTMYSANFYLAEKDGNYYMWVKNGRSLEELGTTGRWELYYVYENKLCYTTFYNSIPGNGYYIQGNLIDLW